MIAPARRQLSHCYTSTRRACPQRSTCNHRCSSVPSARLWLESTYRPESQFASFALPILADATRRVRSCSTPQELSQVKPRTKIELCVSLRRVGNTV